ncbi:MAG: TonB-dependent receptor plug domain-containing protein [Myxococcaceae bacterium]
MVRLSRRRVVVVLLCVLQAQVARAADVKELSLEELLDTPVSVTKEARSARDAASVVLTLTRDEILASGARDLLEVLQLVPGFTFHSDVEGTVGVGFRGLWAHEGKLLVLIDGQEINELLYSTTQFGHHVPAGAIERVEVIRGPGSALYGGSAELAVVNVVTRSGVELEGVAATARLAVGEHGVHDWSVSAVAGGKDAPSHFEWSLLASAGDGQRALRPLADFSGNVVPLNDRLAPVFINAAVTWNGLRLRLIHDDYLQGATGGFGTVTPGAELHFRSTIADATWDTQPLERLSLKARLSLRAQTPWQSRDETSELFYDKSATRLLGGISARWAALDWLQVSGGLEGWWDHAWLNDPRLIGAQTQFGTSNTVSYGTFAAWAQGELTSAIVNATAGARLEVHSAVGANFAPRLALTRQLGPVTAKLLYGGAFRTPGIENLNLAPASGLRAERTHVLEAEVGTGLGDVGFVSVNGFYALIALPIVYGIDPASGSENYRNGGAVSTAGAEALLRLRGSQGHLNVSYSLALPVVADDVSTWLHPELGVAAPLLGMPAQKFALSGKLIVNRFFSVGGSAVYLSGRWGFMPSELLDGVGRLGWVDEALILNAWLGLDHVGAEGLSLQAGVGNVLDANVPFVQPYDGGSAALPGRGREFFVRASFALERP